jgi:hypothetical protein
MDVRAPFQPQPVDIPWAPLPLVVVVGPSDADLARALWDRMMPEYAGLLDAEPTIWQEVVMADWEAAIRQDHVCACVRCDPSLRVEGGRRGDHHIGVRFWGDYPGERSRQRGTMILVDGMEVSGAFEAILGAEGTVWAYRSVAWAGGSGTGYHTCLTCRDAAQRDGLLSEDGFLLHRAADGTEEQLTIDICTIKLVGRVELRRPAAVPDPDGR